MLAVMGIPGCLVALFLVARLRANGMDALGHMPDEDGYDGYAVAPIVPVHQDHGEGQAVHVVAPSGSGNPPNPKAQPGIFGRKLLRKVFLNSGLFLLFGGIVIGFVSQRQGWAVTKHDDQLFLK